jgi:hypothetical protein
VLASAHVARAASVKTITYSIAKQGSVSFGLEQFAGIVDATLNDPRSWSLGGSVRFVRGSRGQFQVTLAAPDVVGGYGGGCNRNYSCRSGFYVLINGARWQLATPTYPGAALLHSYRQLVINHEVGHALRFDHAFCSHAGELAPVMQQQSKFLRGCTRNAWPLPSERANLATRLGITVRAIPPSLVLSKQAGRIALDTPPSTVRRHLGTPDATTPLAYGVQEDYQAAQLSIVYFRDRVQAITTTSPDDISTSRVGVGTGLSELQARLPDARCTLDDPATSQCVWYRGDRPTTFTLQRGVVTSLRIERPLPLTSRNGPSVTART